LANPTILCIFWYRGGLKNSLGSFWGYGTKKYITLFYEKRQQIYQKITQLMKFPFFAGFLPQK